MENQEKYVLHCASCNQKIYTDGKTDLSQLVEIKTAPPPLRADGRNRDTAKMGRRFKCPKCGGMLRPYGIPLPPPPPPPPPMKDLDERSADRRAKKPPQINDFLKEIDRMK